MLCCLLGTHLRVTQVLVAQSQALIEAVKHTQAAVSTSTYSLILYVRLRSCGSVPDAFRWQDLEATT